MAKFLVALGLTLLLGVRSQTPDPFVITLAPVLTPWSEDNATRALQGGSQVAEMNLARVWLGPCTYRMMHSHIYADELFVLLQGSLVSVMIAPNNSVYTHNLSAGDNVVYPKGWNHYQLNPTCEGGSSILSFNARSIGTINTPINLAAASDAYLKTAFGMRNVLEPKGLWVMDPACLARCNTTTNRRLL